MITVQQWLSDMSNNTMAAIKRYICIYINLVDRLGNIDAVIHVSNLGGTVRATVFAVASL